MQDPLAFQPPAHIRVHRTASLLLALIACFYMSLVQLNGVDFWLLAKLGEITWHDGAIPRTLLFPFTEIATAHFNAHEWLSSVLFHLLLETLGEQGMAVLTGTLGVGLFLSLARLAHVHSGAPLPLALLCGLLGLCVENYRHVMRPELIVLFCMALFWIQYEKLVKTFHWKYLLVAALATIAWANMHGSFVLAIFVAAIYAAGALVDGLRATRSLRRAFSQHVIQLCVAAVCIALSTLLNPFGFDLIEFAFGFGGNNDLGKLLGEWTPTFSMSLLPLRGLWIGLAAWTLILFAMISTRRELRSADWLIFAFFTLLAAKAIRFPVFLCFLVPLYVPRALQQWVPALNDGRWFKPLAGTAGLLLLTTITFGNAHGAYPLLDVTRTKFTEAMVREMENPRHTGNVLNSVRLGPELIYRAYPRLRPASDCRLDSYGLDYLLYLDAVLHQPKLFEEFVNRYEVKYLLVEITDFARFEEWEAWKSGDWEVVLVDEKAAFLRRRNH
ncbi:MAG: hypothetical protein H7Y28_07100 [Rhodoferax sp.]|nr:hypothetical protein [Rhodoferax sp.]